LLQYKVVPAVAVLPGEAGQVQAIVALCARAGVPWVARGAGSGLSGGALPVQNGVLLVLSRMKRILDIDLANGRILVEPGVTNLAVSAAVAPEFFYPPDPSSQQVCSIGGNVAENSGGAHCFKYGFTTNYVTGLEVVLADGSVVQLGGPELDAPGYDLLGAFVGSEGTLGVATKIWLRIVPVPEAIKTLVAFFDSTRDAGEAVSDIVQCGVVPAAIARWLASRVRSKIRGDSGDSEDEGIERRAGRPRCRGTRALLESAQSSLCSDGARFAQLLRAGRRNPAHAVAGSAGAHRSAFARVRSRRR
jgi:glycolate oxidase